MPALKQYDAQLDKKSRITIKGAKFRNFVVTHDKNGNIVLQPRSTRAAKPLAIISVRTLKMMDRAMANFRHGKVSEAICLEAPGLAQ
jgi:DNA-binding transcriptional regulator/RsmH inhibitor MraZ